MNYSYVMGSDSIIKELRYEGFNVKEDGKNYMVSFSEDKSESWENFIANNLKLGYWNEYIRDESVVFLFQLEEGLKKYIVKNYEDNEVLKLCEQLCNCNFKSIRYMLSSNHYYRDKIN